MSLAKNNHYRIRIKLKKINYLIFFNTIIGILILSINNIALSQNKWITKETKEMIMSLLEDKITFGLALGVITSEGVEVYCDGKTAIEDGTKINRNTVFRLGSATKAFTGILLADLILKKKIKLNSPIDNYLPKSIKIPEKDGKKIKIIDLATHSSGLPVRPSDYKILENADYSIEQLYKFLPTIKLEEDIGAKFNYSSMGAALIGHIISLLENKSYSQILKDKICNPLGMSSTDVYLDKVMQQRVSKGHDQRKEAVWLNIPEVFAPSGSIYSSLDDLLNFLSVNIGLKESSISNAMNFSHTEQRKFGDRVLGLFWMHNYIEGHNIIGHSGDTFGFSAYIGFDKEQKVGIAVLSNGKMGVREFAFHIISNGKYKLTKENILRWYYE